MKRILIILIVLFATYSCSKYNGKIIFVESESKEYSTVYIQNTTSDKKITYTIKETTIYLDHVLKEKNHTYTVSPGDRRRIGSWDEKNTNKFEILGALVEN